MDEIYDAFEDWQAVYGDDFFEPDYDLEPIYCEECGGSFLAWNEFNGHPCPALDDEL